MHAVTADSFAGLVALALERMAFVSTEPIEKTPAEVLVNAAAHATIELRGSHGFTVTVSATAGMVREVAAGYAGPVTVEASTVTHAFGRPERAAFTTRTGDGRRALASSTESELLALVEQEETAGRAAEIDAEGVLHLT